MPKKLVGGVFLLCLTALTLTLSEDGETYTNITQPEILEQLTNLKNYISNPSMIKPVWVQLKNGDEIVVVQGELKVVDTGEFEICVQLNGYKLVISVEFTQVLNSDDEPLDDWYIDTNDAKYLFTSDAQNVKATIENANFGDVALAGDLSVGGEITGDSIIENMTGYSFVPSSNTEIECYFAGAVKNGNKITFSIFAKITMGAENLPSALTLGHFRIPQEIYNKLVGGFTSDAYLDIKNLYLATNYDSGASVPALMYKSNDEEKQLSVNLYNTQGLTASTEYYCRYEVTFLLSDNLVPEQAGE